MPHAVEMLLGPVITMLIVFIGGGLLIRHLERKERLEKEQKKPD